MTDSDDLQELAPVLLAVAGLRDQAALDLVSRLADEIAAMAGTVLRRLDLAAAVGPRRRAAHGAGPAADGLDHQPAAQARQAQVSVVAVPSIAGAALLGLDRAGAGPAAEGRLRATGL